mmetsp:Transcript_3900/g.12115  ORF Transcript_3900/g.12115 Transcript_3900/m.12115 type:complete len:303 (-) Transcript_3900:263-1171(-)
MTSWSDASCSRRFDPASSACASASSASFNLIARKSFTPSAPSSARRRSSASASAAARARSEALARWSSAMIALTSDADNLPAMEDAVAPLKRPVGSAPFLRGPCDRNDSATCEPMAKRPSTRAKNARSPCAVARTPGASRKLKTLSASVSSRPASLWRLLFERAPPSRRAASTNPARRRSRSASRLSEATWRSSAGTRFAAASARSARPRSASPRRFSRRQRATSSNNAPRTTDASCLRVSSAASRSSSLRRSASRSDETTSSSRRASASASFKSSASLCSAATATSSTHSATTRATSNSAS